MQTLSEVLCRVKTLSFDCYGTLIDWRAGLTEGLWSIFAESADSDINELFSAYVAIEAQVEAEGYRCYRDVLAEVTRRLAAQRRRAISEQQAGELARRLPSWPAFADTREALQRLRRRYRLGVVSNIDHDLLAATRRRLGVTFDVVITAQDVGSYKPQTAPFRRLLELEGPADRVLHVAQSLYHDGAPAAQMGIAFTWINRYKDRNDTDVRPVATLPDLASLAEMAYAD